MKICIAEKLLAGIGCLLMAAPALAADPTIRIKLDQAGYLPALPKVALVSGNTRASDFTVRRAQDGSVVFRGKLGAPVDDADSGDRLQAADFSS